MKIGDFGLKQRKMNKSLLKREGREYVRRNPRLKGVVDLYREIFAVQRRLSGRVPDQLPHIDGGQISWRLDREMTLIEPGELAVDVGLLRGMMRELGRVIGERSGRKPQGWERFLEEELSDDGKLLFLSRAFTERDENALEEAIRAYTPEPSLVYLLLHVSMAPFYWRAAAALARKADLDEIPRGTCPVCGDLPLMGFLRPEDGLRVLECSLCGSRWGIPRIMCPFCRNMDQDKLGYFFAEGDREHRVYFCEKCSKYLKVSLAVRGDGEELVLPLEDLATLHLDRAAEERGYVRGCRTVFS